MRFVTVTDITNLQALGTALLKTPAAGAKAAALDRIEALNPHVDVHKLNPGDVLLVPDLPDIDTGQAPSVGGNAFDGFADEIRRGVETLSQRMRSQSEAVTAERASVNGALKLAGVRRLIENDPQLKKQVADVDAQAKADQGTAQAAAKQLEQLQKLAAGELEALGRLLR